MAHEVSFLLLLSLRFQPEIECKVLDAILKVCIYYERKRCADIATSLIFSLCVWEMHLALLNT